MKNLYILFIGICCGCASSYTDSKFFDCPSPENYKMDSDKKELIYKILNRAVVEEKDIPDYILIKDKKKIYINTIWYESFWSDKPPKTFPLNPTDVPSEIDGVSFCLKSLEELQAIANKTSDFTFLSFGKIEINGSTATIGIDHGWMGQTNDNKVHLSGGGFIWQFKKINGEWMFDKILRHYQS